MGAVRRLLILCVLVVLALAGCGRSKPEAKTEGKLRTAGIALTGFAVPVPVEWTLFHVQQADVLRKVEEATKGRDDAKEIRTYVEKVKASGLVRLVAYDLRREKRPDRLTVMVENLDPEADLSGFVKLATVGIDAARPKGSKATAERLRIPSGPAHRVVWKKEDAAVVTYLVARRGRGFSFTFEGPLDRANALLATSRPIMHGVAFND